MPLFELKPEDIASLDAISLVMLMECVVECELARHGIPLSAAYVSLDITIPDGGEDGLVVWDGGVATTDFLPSRRCLFQAKSGTLSPKQFTSELFRDTSYAEVKTRVKDNFDKNGTYILFYAGACVGKDADDRISEMKGALGPHFPGKDLQIRIYDHSTIASWTEKHIAALTKALRLARKGGLEHFQDWHDWSGFEANRTRFIENDQTERFIQLIRTEMLRNKAVLRIIGRSGLGKTRIAFEAFRPPLRTLDDSARAILGGSVCYVDFLNAGSDVVGLVGLLRRQGLSGTVIVDNCPEDVHERLAEQVTHKESFLSLLSIDYHVDAAPPRAGEFRLEPSPIETIRRMILEHHPTLSERDVDFIAQYADGFPKIAALLRDVSLEDDVRVEPLNDHVLTDRLLRGHATMTEEAYEVIRACALFIHVGFDGLAKVDREYVAARICGITSERFYERAQFFMPRVLDRIGDYVRVSPVPLALHLAETYYESKDPDEHKRLIVDDDMPNELKDALGKRFRDLSSSERAVEVARRLMGPNDPFGRAEVLNTEQGSLIFRSLAEVDPYTGLQALLREFGSLNTEELLLVGPGRRNLIWTLEMLAFNEELFADAAMLLARFAVAENETWGNNATAQMLHLFQPLLAGTEAPPPLRLFVIDELLHQQDTAFVRFGIEALGRAIRSEGEGRTLGAEQQRGRVLKDWHPATWGELFDYLDGAANRLGPYASRDDNNGEFARKQFADGIRNLIRHGRLDSLETNLKVITASYQHAWPAALDAVHSALRNDLRDASEEFRTRVLSWLEILAPKTEAEEIRLVVTSPPAGNIVRETDGTIVDLSAKAAIDLAARYANDYSAWLRILPLVSSDFQAQGFTFGRAVGDDVPPEHQQAFSSAVVTALANAGDNAQPMVVLGYLTALKLRNPELVDQVVDEFLGRRDIGRFAALLVAMLGPTELRLSRCLQLLEAGVLKPNDFRRFGYGKALDSVEPGFVCGFLMKLLQFGFDGAHTALFVAYMFAHGDLLEKWDACKPLFRSILSLEGIFESPGESFDDHALEDSAKILLKSDTDESQLAANLMRQMLKVCSKRKLDFHAFSIMRPVLFVLLERYSAVVWPMLKTALGKGDSFTEWHLLHLLQNNLSMPSTPKSAFQLLSNEEILTWCHEQPKLGPRIIAASLPLFKGDEDRLVPHPLVAELLDVYGDDRRVLSALSANLGSFSFAGSLVPAYAQRLAFVRLFMNHSNSAVRTWATALAASYAAQVDVERKRDEEHEEGIFAERTVTCSPKNAPETGEEF